MCHLEKRGLFKEVAIASLNVQKVLGVTWVKSEHLRRGAVLAHQQGRAASE
jgi:hypothetical protein